MEEKENKRLCNNQTLKVRTKKIVARKQIIIRKNGTKINNNISKKKNSSLSKIDENSILHKSALLSKANHNDFSIIKDNFDLNHILFNPRATINYNKTFGRTIIRPTIIKQSFLKPIFLPINIRSSATLNERYFTECTMKSNSQDNYIMNKSKLDKNDSMNNKNQICEKINNKKENINPNISDNTIKRKVIIQKSIKYKTINVENEKLTNKMKTKDKLLIYPQPKEQDGIRIQKINKNNSPKLSILNRNKFKTLQPKIQKETIFYNTIRNNERIMDKYKFPNTKNEEIISSNSNPNNFDENNLRKSMKPIEKINNITVNNTLRKTYKEMIKNKKIVVGLNSYMEKENNKERGPRDSLKFMENK